MNRRAIGSARCRGLDADWSAFAVLATRSSLPSPDLEGGVGWGPPPARGPPGDESGLRTDYRPGPIHRPLSRRDAANAENDQIIESLRLCANETTVSATSNSTLSTRTRLSQRPGPIHRAQRDSAGNSSPRGRRRWHQRRVTRAIASRCACGRMQASYRRLYTGGIPVRRTP